MEVRSFLWTMGLGMAAGAAVGMLVPKNSPLQKAADQAAHTVEQAADKAMTHLMQ
jgi:hypothetical protein